MSSEGKISAKDVSLSELMKDKFDIEFFQREYRWEKSHITQLIDDLTGEFSACYKEGSVQKDVAKYSYYFLGPVILRGNEASEKKSIIDGQQRITSLTLLFIYLKHRSEYGKEHLSNLIYSEKYGEKSFNMTDPEREDVLKALFDNGECAIEQAKSETVRNIIERFNDINDVFPDDIIREHNIKHFIDWLMNKVIVVRVLSDSDEQTQKIFETMNDRGLSLTPAEMLKGYVISKIAEEHRHVINNIWKEKIERLHKISKDADLKFFQTWFRAKYANKMREGKVGSKNEDFEIIGTKFHQWFQDHHKNIIGIETEDEFYDFFKENGEFSKFVDYYILIKTPATDTILPNLLYIQNWGIAESLQDTILLAGLLSSDAIDIIHNKINAASKYIEIFVVSRRTNHRNCGQASIKYTMFGVAKEIRNKSFDESQTILQIKVNAINEEWDGLQGFMLNGINKKFVKHFLARITAYLDSLGGKHTYYKDYYNYKTSGKPFEIEHIISDKYEEYYREVFDDKSDFSVWRNAICSLGLLPNGNNQSYNAAKYESKLPHYIKENAYMQSLCTEFYIKNTNFTNNPKFQELNLEPMSIINRENLKKRISVLEHFYAQIWGNI